MFNHLKFSIRHQDFNSETPFLAPTPLRYVREIQRATCTVCEVSMKIGRFSIEIFEFKKFSMNSKHIGSCLFEFSFKLCRRLENIQLGIKIFVMKLLSRHPHHCDMCERSSGQRVQCVKLE